MNVDARADLALLRVNGLEGETARLRRPHTVRLGESVMVFGFPLAGSLSSGGNFTSGHVSALRGLKDAEGELQITAPVQPGNSGGPLLDASGLVIGVVQAKLDALKAAISTGDIPQNVNFAIALDVLAVFLAKNGIAIRDGTPSAPLNTVEVAELAQRFTYQITCRKTIRHTEVPAPALHPDISAQNLSRKLGWVRSLAMRNDCEGVVEITLKNDDGMREIYEAACKNKTLDFTCDFRGAITIENGIPFVAVSGKNYSSRPACWFSIR